MKKKTFLIIVFSVFLFLLRGQDKKYEILATVDSAEIKVGERLLYTLQVKLLDSITKLKFSPKPNFNPFEILENLPIDTIKASSHYLFTKQYALIQFDSGRYVLPPQKVLIEDELFLSDSILIEVKTIPVDTVQKKIYDIKSIISIEKNYDLLYKKILFWGGVLIFLGLLFYFILFKRKHLFLKNKNLLPFERAIYELKALETFSLETQEEYKAYYSHLTDIVKKYLEKEVKIFALENTTDELLIKLDTLKKTKEIKFKKETLDNLKKLLQIADLIKFAKASVDINDAKEDKSITESIIVQIREAIPEPDFENIRKQEEHLKFLKKEKRKKQFKIVLLSALGVLVLGIVSSIIIFGYYPVRDTLLLHPTKKIISKKWITSGYGSPIVRISAPDVLLRQKNTPPNQHIFTLNNMGDKIFMELKISKGETIGKDIDADSYTSRIISKFESLGAINILIKNDEYQLNSIKVPRIYGSLDYPKKSSNKRVRCNYTIFIIPFEKGNIQITILYEQADRYTKRIQEKIVNSLKFPNLK